VEDLQHLAQIAQRKAARTRRQWRHKEQESYAAYAGSSHEIREWKPVIQAWLQHVRECPSRRAADAFLDRLKERLATTVAAVRQILEGERDIEVLRQDWAAKPMCCSYIMRSWRVKEPTLTLPRCAGRGVGGSRPVLGADDAQREQGRGNAACPHPQQWNDVIQTSPRCEGNAQAAGQLSLSSTDVATDDCAHSSVLRHS